VGAARDEGPRATGAWLEGDPPGERRFVDVHAEAPLELEAGGRLGGDVPVTVAYETWGTLSAGADNVVLVEHALTGTAHVARHPEHEGSPPGWWEGLVGPGRPIDTDRFFVVVTNVLGGCQGTTGPSSRGPDGRRYANRFPTITIRDQVAAEQAALEALGISSLHAVVGGSLGGMRALEWALLAPERVERLVLMACGPAATAEQIALCHVQAATIRADAGFAGGDYYDAGPGHGPRRGLAIARQLGQVTYRSREEFRERFGRDHQAEEDPLQGGRFAVESYLEYQGDKLVERFDANSYLVLSRAMDLHDVGRGRGGIPAALKQVRAPSLVVGFDSDRLYHPDEQEALAEFLPLSHPLEILPSEFGHDAFLLELHQLAPLVAEALG
jgi:homoserine O-acetyltransferase/O-succinyltransferase